MNNYWNQYYNSTASSHACPSQFAAFVINECGPENIFVDIGCGNGRDARFFLQYGAEFVLAVDSSSSAISYLESQRSASPGTLKCICSDIAEDGLAASISDAIDNANTSRVMPMCIYSRFFLHAIDGDSESKLLDLAARLLRIHGGILAVEFRTLKDESTVKIAKSHFRRYINPSSFIVSAASYGLSVKYFIEGFGFAKFGSEDAHVARLILELR